MNHARLLPLIILPLGLLACKPNQGHESSKSKPASLQVYSVGASSIERGDLQIWREWVGKLVSVAQAPILPQIEGYISERNFSNGQVVHQGQVLYQIQDELYLQAYEEAKQKVKSLEATYQKAQQDADYYRPLVADGSVSRQRFSDAEQTAKAAAASLAQAKAAAAHADTLLGYCTLRSPMNGVVGFAQAFVGSYVSPSGKALVTVNQLDPIRIYFSISEQDWLQQGGKQGPLSQGAKLHVQLADGKIYDHQATIVGVDNQVNSQTGSIMMDASVANPQDLLRPGMYVMVKARIGAVSDILKVPVSAIVQVQGKSMILLLPQGGEVKLVPVSLGVREGNWVEIEGEGLKEGDQVVSKGTQQGMMAAMGRAKLKLEP